MPVLVTRDYRNARNYWHQLEQARWYEVKKGIANDKYRLNAVYSEKYDEFSLDLQHVLAMFDTCQRHHGTDGYWMNTHGLLFHAAFTAIYRRP